MASGASGPCDVFATKAAERAEATLRGDKPGRPPVEVILHVDAGTLQGNLGGTGLFLRARGCCEFPGCDHRRFLEGHQLHTFRPDGKPVQAGTVVPAAVAEVGELPPTWDGERIDYDAIFDYVSAEARGVDCEP